MLLIMSMGVSVCAREHQQGCSHSICKETLSSMSTRAMTMDVQKGHGLDHDALTTFRCDLNPSQPPVDVVGTHSSTVHLYE